MSRENLVVLTKARKRHPEGVWYTFVDHADIDDIVNSHLKNGQVVERLRLSPDVGR